MDRRVGARHARAVPRPATQGRKGRRGRAVAHWRGQWWAVCRRDHGLSGSPRGGCGRLGGRIAASFEPAVVVAQNELTLAIAGVAAAIPTLLYLRHADPTWLFPRARRPPAGELRHPLLDYIANSEFIRDFYERRFDLRAHVVPTYIAQDDYRVETRGRKCSSSIRRRSRRRDCTGLGRGAARYPLRIRRSHGPSRTRTSPASRSAAGRSASDRATGRAGHARDVPTGQDRSGSKPVAKPRRAS